MARDRKERARTAISENYLAAILSMRGGVASKREGKEGGGMEENGLFDCKGRENGRGRLSVSSSR